MRFPARARLKERGTIIAIREPGEHRKAKFSSAADGLLVDVMLTASGDVCELRIRLPWDEDEHRVTTVRELIDGARDHIGEHIAKDPSTSG